MSSLNQLTLIGHVGQDPTVKTFDGGEKVGNFSVATSFKFQDKDYTTWHNCQVKGKLLDIVEKYVKKGGKVCVQGMQLNREYTDKDGQKKTIYYVSVQNLVLLGAKEQTTNNYSASASQVSEPTAKQDDDMGLPF